MLALGWLSTSCHIKKLKFSLNTVNQSLSMQQHGVIYHAIIAWWADSKLSRCPALSCKRELRKKHNQFWLLPSSKVQKTLGARQALGHYLAPRLTTRRLNAIKHFFYFFFLLLLGEVPAHKWCSVYPVTFIDKQIAVFIQVKEHILVIICDNNSSINLLPCREYSEG